MAVALMFVALPPPALAQSDPSAQIDAYLTKFVKSDNFGGQVLVAKDGKVIFEKAYGLANREHNVAATMETRYPIAEVSAGVTAAAILMLQDQGKLNVNDPVCKYIEGCPKSWAPITLHHLLNYTAGIPNVFAQPDRRSELYVRHTPDQLIDMLKTLPILSTPGDARWAYSPMSYTLLAKVVEKASGVPYAKFVKDNIFDKLGMSNTGVDDATRVLKNRAEGYVLDAVKGQYIDPSNYYGFGSLYSTADDLFKFQQAVMSGKLFSPASVKTMLTASTGPLEESYEHFARMGYAWEIDDEDVGLDRALLYNFDKYWMPEIPSRGFVSSIEYFPNQKVALILLSNSGHNYSTLLQSALPWLKSIK